MNKQEKVRLNQAIDLLFENPCRWEDAMEILFPLAGRKYRNPMKVGGTAVPLMEIAINDPDIGPEKGMEQ